MRRFGMKKMGIRSFIILNKNTKIKMHPLNLCYEA